MIMNMVVPLVILVFIGFVSYFLIRLSKNILKK